MEDRRLCIFAFSAISHGYIRDLWPDFDSISRRGLFTYWHLEYVHRLMLRSGLYCFDVIIQIYLLCYLLRRDDGMEMITKFRRLPIN